MERIEVRNVQLQSDESFIVEDDYLVDEISTICTNNGFLDSMECSLSLSHRSTDNQELLSFLFFSF